MDGIWMSGRLSSPVAGDRTPGHILRFPMTKTSASGRSGRPARGEYGDYAQADIDRVEGDDAVAVLERLAAETLAFLRGLPEEKLSGIRYAPGKWTIKDIV